MILKPKCAERIKELLEDISPSDIKAAEKELKLSRTTIDKYLSGKVANIDTAIEIINFFKKRIQEKLDLL